MQQNRYILLCLTILCCYWLPQPVAAQLGYDVDVKKPKIYENRVLEAEKTDKKKFKLPRHIMQNTTTHYNYYFNANNKINEVIDQAKSMHADDYSALLPFYNYSLEVTAQNKMQL